MKISRTNKSSRVEIKKIIIESNKCVIKTKKNIYVVYSEKMEKI